MNPFLRKARLVATYALRAAARAIAAVLLFLLAPIGFREILLFAGSALIGYGLFPVCPPAAFAVPGIIIAYVAIFGVS